MKVLGSLAAVVAATVIAAPPAVAAGLDQPAPQCGGDKSGKKGDKKDDEALTPASSFDTACDGEKKGKKDEKKDDA
jgi:hypothetical protein